MNLPLPDPNLPWAIPLEAVRVIAESESLRLKAYRCPAGVPTIGWGETDGVRMGDICTKEQADAWLCEDVAERARAVRGMCTVDPGDSELGAMVSLAYNIGVDGLRGSTVLRQHNAGNRQAAARAFSLWNKAKNKNTGKLEVLDGLTLRRAREAALYLTPDDSMHAEPMPQAVEAESKLTASPINVSGAATIVTGGGLTISAVTDQIQQASGLLSTIKGSVAQLADFIGFPPVVLVGVGLVVLGWIIVKNRRAQRSQGWA